METAIRQHGVKSPIAVHGYNGGKTADLLNGNLTVSADWKSVDVVLQETKPTIVLILIGTNDEHVLEHKRDLAV